MVLCWFMLLKVSEEDQQYSIDYTLIGVKNMKVHFPVHHILK